MSVNDRANAGTCARLSPTPQGLAAAADLLRRGQCVAVPTETVYGLAANALDEHAARGIFLIKGRPLVDPLIVHVADARAVGRYAHVPAQVQTLADAFWPGPLTLVLPKRSSVPDLVTAGLPSVALRVPAHPAMRALLERLDFPLAAPSANPFGYVSPTTADHVLASLGDRLAAVLDAGPCEHGVESTILDLRDPRRPTLLRPGPITQSQLEAALGVSVHRAAKRPPDESAQLAPGMLTRHYAPHTPIDLLPCDAPHRAPAAGEASMLITRPSRVDSQHVYWLSENGDLREAARQLFSLLRHLDTAGYQRITAQLAPEHDLGITLNDRLRRAAAKRAE
jgi:L-threonylcarbamoyladenylate synthase